MRGSEWFLQESPYYSFIHITYWVVYLEEFSVVDINSPEGPTALSAPFVAENRSVTSSKSRLIFGTARTVCLCWRTVERAVRYGACLV